MVKVTKSMRDKAAKVGRENWRYAKYIKTVCARELDRTIREYRDLPSMGKEDLVRACVLEIAKSKR